MQLKTIKTSAKKYIWEIIVDLMYETTSHPLTEDYSHLSGCIPCKNDK